MSKKYRLTNDEHETVITFDDGDVNATVYTLQAKHVRRLDKLCSKHPDLFKCTRRDEYGGAEYMFPQSYVSFRGPRTVTMSEEQRRKAAERLHNRRLEH